jgi:hypothetical protein
LRGYRSILSGVNVCTPQNSTGRPQPFPTPPPFLLLPTRATPGPGPFLWVCASKHFSGETAAIRPSPTPFPEDKTSSPLPCQLASLLDAPIQILSHMPLRRLHIYYTQDEIPSISLPMVLSIIPHAPPKLNVALPKALLLSSSRLKDERWRLVFFVPSSILCLLHTGACAHTAQRSTPATPRPSSDASHRPPTATLRTPTRTLRSVVVVAHSILNPTSRGLSSKGKVALLATCLACRAYVRTVTCAVSHPIPYIHTPLLQHTHTHTHTSSHCNAAAAMLPWQVVELSFPSSPCICGLYAAISTCSAVSCTLVSRLGSRPSHRVVAVIGRSPQVLGPTSRICARICSICLGNL